MTLYSNPTCFFSHRARLVMAEKSIHIDVIDVDGVNLPEDLLDLNPYHSVPTLIDRDLVLYDSRVIIEYLDERFPHPPLMPVDPGYPCTVQAGPVPYRKGLVHAGAADRRGCRQASGYPGAEDSGREHYCQ